MDSPLYKQKGSAMKSNVGFHSSHKVVYVKRHDSLAHAFNLMKRISTRHLPVLDEKGVVIGMLSDRDVLRAMKKPVGSDWVAVPANPEFNPEDIVQQYMGWPVGSIEESAPLAQAAKTMLENKISALVVTKDHHAIGIVTTEDLLEAFINDHKSTLSDVKNQIYGAIYRSPVGSILQSLADVGI
ncbi:MAG: hypothetical protein B7Y39_01485 [Bdellovibrio sp. 28-41-41]|nr:MAG: hypothetical protein B7Y39_01485 [Bdellovibrio sp. 28-41-41]